MQLAFICCQGTASYYIMIYHFITGKKDIHFLNIYSDNIMIYHSITGGREHSYIITYSANIIIYHHITGEEDILT